MRASQPKSEDGHRQELELFDRSLWSVAPTTRGLSGDPRAAPALKDISAIHDSDEYEDQPFVILESVEVSHEPRIDPGRQLLPH
jgi:hypothetical protein